LANDIDVLTSQPPPLKTEEWMRDAGAKVLWPLSSMEYKAWENRSLKDIRSALKLKAASREVKLQRKDTMIMSEAMTNEA
jgi:hypothetical protein